MQLLSSLGWDNVIPLASAILLFLTYKSQLKNNKVNLQLAELERKGKRAEYMPLLEVSTTGLKDADAHDAFQTLPVYIKSIKNSFQIDEIKHDEPESDFFEIITPEVDKKKIFTSGDQFMIYYKINLKREFSYKASKSLPHISDIKIDILYTDMLGNRYSITISITNNEKVTITERKHLD